jgi:ABC-type lipoprotein release transport system permease subunit
MVVVQTIKDSILKNYQLLLIFLGNKSALKMAISVVMGVAFSISVILATIGIMDGFVKSLRQGLARSSGELIIHSESGFFNYDNELKSVFESYNVKNQAPIIVTEGFLITGETSKGVLVKGIDSSFAKVTGLNITPVEGEAVIGKELALALSLVKGDSVVIAFANGNEQFSTLPLLIRLKISEIVEHGIYQKDLRFVYINQKTLQESLKLEGKVNTVLLNVPSVSGDARTNAGDNRDDSEIITNFRAKLIQTLPFDMVVKPYWSEYEYIVDAVKVEKNIISLILQLVVIIAMFNVLAFLIYLREDNLKELFLLRALGLSGKGVVKIWAILVAIIGPVSCGLSIVFVKFFDYCLRSWDIFKLPGDVYTLGGPLKISLELNDYLFVFGVSLVWLILVVFIISWRFRNHPISGGLRKEFA